MEFRSTRIVLIGRLTINDLVQKYKRESEWLLESMRLFDAANKNSDSLAAASGLLGAAVRAGILRDFFDAISIDLFRVLKEFDWPEFPENYKVPEKYGYRGPK